MHDLVIRNGTLIDGSGKGGVRGDVAVDGDRIVALGRVEGAGIRTLDAEGRIVTPGFVDVHTHLDAQLKWDPFATPACWHGVTTVLLGNCGVTFAPVRPEHHEDVARMLESVEEIPTASSMAALTWRWERYGEYLEDLEGTPKGVNVAGLIGHAATRYYAMGEASIDSERHPSAGELATMQELVDEAIGAGALGFSTSQTKTHKVPDGRPIPGTFAKAEEHFALADVLGKRGRGVYQWAPGFGEFDAYPNPGEEFPIAREHMGWFGELSRRTGRPVVFGMFSHEAVPTVQTQALSWMEEERSAGANMRPMLSSRVNTVFTGLQNWPVVRTPAWQELFARPFRERLAALDDATWRSRLLEGTDKFEAGMASRLYLFGPDDCAYRREETNRLGVVAEQHGERPVATMIRLFRETQGRQLFVFATNNHRYEAVEEILDHPLTILGLGDSGAHVTAICDASLTTHAITHWCHERRKFSIEEVIRRLTSDPADAFGIKDRGRLQVGAKADINVIDLESLEMVVPEFVHDFPGGAGRWTQKARGYDYTIVNGHVAIEHGNHTGRLGGELIRGGN